MGGRQSRISPDAIALAVLLLLPTILFADVIFGGNTFSYRDLTSFFYPNDAILRAILKSGEFPYWNPFTSGGQPLAANPNFGVFYPPKYLILLPDFALGYRLQIVLHLHLAIAAMYLLLRSMRLAIASAAFGAVTFGIGGLFLSYLNVPPFLFTLAWLPLVLLFFRRFLKSARKRDFAAASLLLGILLLAGEPTTILQSGLLMAAYAFYLGLRDRELRWARRIAAAGTNIARAAAVIVAGSLVACAQLLPAIAHMRETARVGGLTSYAYVSAYSMPPVRALELIFPGILGHHADVSALYWGAGFYGGRAPYLGSIYVGLFAAVLLLAGLLIPSRGRWLVIALLVASYLLAIGHHSPLLELLFDSGLIPTFRYPEKLILFGLFAGVIFSAVIFDRAARGDRIAIRAALLVSAAITFLASLLYLLSWLPAYRGWFGAFWHLSPQVSALGAEASRADWLAVAVRGAVCALLLALLRKGTPQRAWYGAAALFLLFDLGTRANAISRMPGEFLNEPPVAAQLNPDRSAFRIFHEPGIAISFGATPPWPSDSGYWLFRNGLYFRSPSAWGFPTVLDGDYDLTNLGPTRELFEAFLRTRDLGLKEFPEVYYAMSNVGYVVRMKPGDPRRFVRDAEEQIPVEIAARQYPRYYFADQIVPVREFDEFVELTVRRQWSPRVAFVQFAPFTPAAGRVLSAAESPNSVLLQVETGGNAFLVVGVTPHKYWQATLDGKRVPLARANVGYQGLAVPAGRHSIALRYRNPLVTAGAAVSAAAVLALLGMLALPAGKPKPGSSLPA